MAPQNLIEFCNLATRPLGGGPDGNGLGLTAAVADSELAGFETLFHVLDEPSGVFSRWQSLVIGSGIIGRRVFDARLVAVALENGISYILTFDARHFKAFSAITVVELGGLTGLPSGP